MPRPTKPLTAYPLYCVTVWEAIRQGRLPRSDASDPCGYPHTQYLDFPDRRSCEATRHNLTKYRDAFGKLAHSMASPGKPGSAERIEAENNRRTNTFDFSQMMAFSVSIRNMQYPLERKFSHIYSLPDGPHRLYLIERGIDLEPHLLSQLKPREDEKASTNASRLVGGSSPGQCVLEELGYTRSGETVELSEDELFEEGEEE